MQRLLLCLALACAPPWAACGHKTGDARYCDGAEWCSGYVGDTQLGNGSTEDQTASEQISR